MKTTIKLVTAAVIACGGFVGAASALTKAEREKAWDQEWKIEAEERAEKDNKFGPRCQDRFTSRGTGKVGLGITQIWAKLRTERQWHEAAIKLYGPEYASWRKAKGKDVRCETKSDMLLCKAAANPCK